MRTQDFVLYCLGYGIAFAIGLAIILCCLLYISGLVVKLMQTIENIRFGLIGYYWSMCNRRASIVQLEKYLETVSDWKLDRLGLSRKTTLTTGKIESTNKENK